MKYLTLKTTILTLCLFSCHNKNEHKETVVKVDTTKIVSSLKNSNDKQEIQNLIRKVLNWSESKNSINLLPALTDSTDSSYVG